jgi:hypothetical protein
VALECLKLLKTCKMMKLLPAAILARISFCSLPPVSVPRGIAISALDMADSISAGCDPKAFSP